MVRSGEFELRLVRSDGLPCPEVEHNGRAYAVASPGTLFVIQIIKHPNPFVVPTPGIIHNACVYVDGQSVGYCKNMRQPGVAKFDGFLAEGDTQGCSFQSFVFSAPRESEEKQATGLNFVEGSIRAAVWLAVQTATPAGQQRFHGPASTNESVAKMPEGKKFFLAPSLTTGKGALRTGPGFSPYGTQRLGGPVAMLELRYETATTLLLRGVLKDSDPAHRAILQQFPETAQAEESEADDDESAACSSHAAGRKRSRQAAIGRRHEQQGQGRPQRQRQAELIDLTKAPCWAGRPRAEEQVREPEEGDEVLAARRENKTLECDLTAEEEPQWRAVKQEAIDV
ncbi:hypothetical protein ABPG75_011122 [Micractinium tetrahymenae]